MAREGDDDRPWPLRWFTLGSVHPVTWLMWGILLVEGFLSLLNGRWNALFVGFATFALTLIPAFGARWQGVRIPSGFMAAVVTFIVGTLYLGEVWNFYQRFWWWDIVLHSGSAVGFGMIGTVVVLLLIRGDRLEAPPILGATLAFSFAVAIGVIWEIFEFGMDQLVGTNMQKSGLVDTMTDLIVDCLGALVGAAAGFGYLRGRPRGRLALTIARFVDDNLSARWKARHDGDG